MYCLVLETFILSPSCPLQEPQSERRRLSSSISFALTLGEQFRERLIWCNLCSGSHSGQRLWNPSSERWWHSCSLVSAVLPRTETWKLTGEMTALGMQWTSVLAGTCTTFCPLYIPLKLSNHMRMYSLLLYLSFLMGRSHCALAFFAVWISCMCHVTGTVGQGNQMNHLHSIYGWPSPQCIEKPHSSTWLITLVWRSLHTGYLKFWLCSLK